MSALRSLSNLIAVGALTSLTTLSLAEVPVKPTAESSNSTTNTTITSQKMTVRNQENKAIFEGSVVLIRGPLVVQSDVMVVSFKPVEQGGTSGKAAAKPGPGSDKGSRSAASELPIMGNRSVSMIEAMGRVQIKQADGQATCRRAVYHGDEDKLVLTGNPVAWQKGARVTGKKITMYLAENRSVVEGESRVMIEQEGEGR